MLLMPEKNGKSSLCKDINMVAKSLSSINNIRACARQIVNEEIVFA